MAALALAVLLTMQTVEDLAEQAGVDAIELQGAVNATGLEPVVYLRMTGEIPTPRPVTPYGVWDRLAECESGGNWHINAYHDGGLQFLPSTWVAYGGRQYAAFAYQASREQQIAIAQRVQAAAGWGQWPVCSRRLETKMTREDFLALAWPIQKERDLRIMFRTEPGEGPLKARCIRPDHRDATPSLVISEDHAYCYGCGTFWWPDQFLRELGEQPLITTPSARRAVKTARLIPMAMVLTYNKWLNTHYQARLEWLLARGLRLEDSINLNKLGHDGSAFVIPVIEDDIVQSLRFRRDDAWHDELEENPLPKYWGMAGRNMVQIYKPRIPDWVPVRSDYVHLCEGELDALRLAQEGLPAWSLTNGCRSFRPEHVKAFEGLKVRVMYDQDPEGRKAGQRVSRLLGTRPVVWPEVLGKDVTEFLQRWSLQALLNHL